MNRRQFLPLLAAPLAIAAGVKTLPIKAATASLPILRFDCYGILSLAAGCYTVRLGRGGRLSCVDVPGSWYLMAGGNDGGASWTGWIEAGTYTYLAPELSIARHDLYDVNFGYGKQTTYRAVGPGFELVRFGYASHAG